MKTIWDVLGIKPTDDEREIRRAYARELKLRRPSQDPQGFQELREAFDSAKRYASSKISEPQEQVTLYEEPESTPRVEDIQPLVQAAITVPEISWSQNELWPKAHSLSILLIKDELQGLGELHQYLDNEIPDALDARQAFSLMLARELSEQPGLYRSLLNEVSAVMSWQLDSISAPQLSHWTLLALEEQITLTEQENYWQELAWKYTGSRLKELQWRLLTEKGTPIPWWGRRVPGLFDDIIEIRKRHPDLQERLNPLLLREYFEPGKIVNWELIATLFFWVYTTWTASNITPHRILLSGLILVVVGSFWCYSALEPRFKTRGIREKCIHAFFWLVSVALLAMAAYCAWQVSNELRENTSKYPMAAAGLIILVIPIGAALWQNRYAWRTVPITIVVATLKFPLVLIRKLPPVINVLALVVLSLLYGAIIQMPFILTS